MVRSIWPRKTYWDGQSALILLTIVSSFSKISVCLRDSLASFSLSSNTTTIYSTLTGMRKRRSWWKSRGHLITPKKLVACSAFQAIPGMKELGDSMFSHMVGILLGFVPFQRRARGQKSHFEELNYLNNVATRVLQEAGKGIGFRHENIVLLRPKLTKNYEAWRGVDRLHHPPIHISSSHLEMLGTSRSWMGMLSTRPAYKFTSNRLSSSERRRV